MHQSFDIYQYNSIDWLLERLRDGSWQPFSIIQYCKEEEHEVLSKRLISLMKTVMKRQRILYNV